MNPKHLKFYLSAGLLVCFFNTAALEQSSSIKVIDESLLVVANQHSDSISIISLGSFPKVISEVSTGRSPQTVTYVASTQNLWVANQDENTLAVISTEDYSVEGYVQTKDSPFGVVTDGEVVFVTNQKANLIQVFDVSNYVELAAIEVDAEPRGMTLSDDKSRLFVTHFVSGKVTVINTRNLEVETTISIGARAGLTQSISIDSEKSLAYIPNTIRNLQNVNLAFDTTVFPFVSIIDLRELTHLRGERIAVDVIDEPVGIPLESMFDGNFLYVLNAASNDLTVINTQTNISSAHIELGAFPIGIDYNDDANELYVDNSLDGTVSILNSETFELVQNLEVTKIPLDSSILNGLKLFHSSDDERMSKDQWISCATCHFDGEEDQASWLFPDGLRNTPSLIGSGDTLPLHWSGNLDEMQDVEETIRIIQGGSGLVTGSTHCNPSCDGDQENAGRSIELDDLSLYIKSLKHPLRSISADPSEEQAVARGEAIFFDEDIGCSECHLPPLYTDNLNHQLSRPDSSSALLNTPSLVRLAWTGPYLHDGVAPNLMEVLSTWPKGYEHGNVEGISEKGLSDLISFLYSLEPKPEMIVKSSSKESSTPNHMPPATARAKITFSIELVEASQENSLEISYSYGANVPTDVYIVVQHTKTGLYWLIDQQLGLHEIDEQSFFATRSEANPISYQSFKFPEVSLSSDQAKDQYDFYAVVVEAGKTPYDTSNWLSSSVTALYP